jgi:CHASE3 domain sensor protein
MWLRETLRRAFTWLAMISILPVIVALIGSGYISYRYDLLLNDTRHMVEHSLEVATAINGLMRSLEDAETGQRGYIITGDETYLEPYRNARDELAGSLSRLHALLGDSASQAESLEGVETLTQSKLAELGRTIDVRRNEGFEAARAIIASDEGRDIMDRIRDEVATMHEREASIAAESTDNMRRAESRAVVVVIVCVLLGITGRVLSMVIPVFWRRSRIRMRARHQRAQRG